MRSNPQHLGERSAPEEYNDKEVIVSVAEYRKLLNDYTTADERIQERIDYLVRYTRKIIKTELQKLCPK